jgi:hypothetical protein
MAQTVASLAALLADPRRVAELTRDNAAAALAEASALLAALAARLAETQAEPPPAAAKVPPAGKPVARWLTVAQVADRLGRDPRWVYRRCHRWPFVHREGRSLLFNEAGLTQYMERCRLES